MKKLSGKVIALIIVFMSLAACKKEGKVANPVAVQLYKVSITAFPDSPPGGGTWDTPIVFSDPYGRPDLLLNLNDNFGGYVGAPYGYLRLNADHGNLPLNFDIDTLNIIPLDRLIYMTVNDNDDFDPDDYMGAVQTDTLSKFKVEQPGYISATSGSVSARFYITWM